MDEKYVGRREENSPFRASFEWRSRSVDARRANLVRNGDGVRELFELDKKGEVGESEIIPERNFAATFLRPTSAAVSLARSLPRPSLIL